MKKCKIEIGQFAEKQLRKIPRPILESLRRWIRIIEKKGLAEMRKIRGYSDEALKGDRAGQRSSRLNRAYRVIYQQQESEDVTIVAIQEVNKHDY